MHVLVISSSLGWRGISVICSALLAVDPPIFNKHYQVSTESGAYQTAGKYGPDKIGVTLMNAAFHPQNGPLTDQTLEAGERQALMQLMVGAIGSYKNPASHRKVEIARDEAREMIILASHLLKIVDARPV